MSLAQARRMLWRAGFGLAPGQAEKLAGQPLEQVVWGLTRPVGAAKLVGPEPTDDEGQRAGTRRRLRSGPLLVARSHAPIRSAARGANDFIWHDWFANSNEKVNSQQTMLDQNKAHSQVGLPIRRRKG